MLSRDCQVLTYTTEWIMIKKNTLYPILYCRTYPSPQTQLPQFQKGMNPISLKPGLVPKDIFKATELQETQEDLHVIAK